MPRIHILPERVVKKIAAGEVIERPASVVKELTENAVDAGATEIGVAIDDGGRTLIRVTDDGCGMSADELPLAVAPHATSKINDEDDLFRVRSLGFRGEALASIGAVSRLRIVSRPHEAGEGAEIIVEGEEVRTCRAAGCRPGTTIEVRDLFYNVPARRKFLRHVGTETGQVTTQFARIALAHPKTAFMLARNGRESQRLPGDSETRARIGQLFSPELGEALIAFERDDAAIGIEGYAGRPADSRSNANWQFTFLNGRFIRDKYVQHAVKEAYRGLIDPNRAPVVFLFIRVDPSAVDVNVHPTKIEVRWSESNMVHGLVLTALRGALRSTDLAPALQTGGGRGGHRPFAMNAQAADNLRLEFADQMKQALATAVDAPPGAQPPSGFLHGATPPSWNAPSTVRANDDMHDDPRAASPGGSRHSIPSIHDSNRFGSPLAAWEAAYGHAGDRSSPSPPDQATPGDAGRSGSADALGSSGASGIRARGAIQLHNSYLVCETDDGMMIIDQHALHERVLYNQLTERITQGPLASQRLLLPETINVTAAQLALIERAAALLQRVGLEMAPFGKDSLAIHSVPSVLRDTDAVGFVRDLLDKLESQEHELQAEHVIADLLAMMACKAAVKAGDPLSTEEIAALLAQKDLVDKSSNCPHGRPTTLRLSVRDLERQFKRR
ncbi:MAG: DNA mismatch repair endonuclease MutL [Phycisphaerales bacterium]|nr:DNA mismatch repair endonuclease MutL [Phycisphaerales bacterium]